jgi:hypothetical protein
VGAVSSRAPSALAAVAALALVVGCGDDDQETTAAGTETAAAPTTTTTTEADSEPAAEGPGAGEADGDGDGGASAADGGNNGAGAAGGNGGASPEELVEETVEAALGGNPQEACSEYVTPEFVKAAYGSASGCRGAQGAGADFAVAVSEVRVSGSTAKAKAKPSAGTYQGEELDVALVREGEDWKLDKLTSDIPAGP